MNGDKAEKFAFLLIVVLFFLSSAFFIDVKHYRLKLLTMELSAVALVVLFFLHAAFAKGKATFKENKLDIWVWLYFGYVILRYAFYPDKSLSQMEIEKNILCVGLYLGFSQTAGKHDIESVLKIFSLSAILVALYGLWQNFGTPILWFRVPRISPPYATFGNQNFFAAYLVITLPFLFLLLSDKIPLLKISGAIGLAVYTLDFIFIRSRGGILSAFVSLFVFFYLKYKHKIRNVKVFIAAVFLLAGVGMYSTKKFWLRDTSRLLIWRDTIVMAVKNPFGVGPGAFAASFPKYASARLKKIYPQKRYIVNFAHNEYLEIFAELGPPGLALFLILIYVFFRNSRNPYLIASAAGILFHNLFSVNMRFIISAGFLYVVFALSAVESAKKITLEMNAFKRVFLLILVFAVPRYFIPKIFEPIRVYRETAHEPDFFENVRQDEISRLEGKLAESPENYDVLYRLGWLCAKKKEWQKASEYFLRAAKIRPTAGLWNNLGNIFFETGNRKKAIECYKNALKMNPDSVDARFNLGYTYFYQGKLSQAAVCFNEVLKRDKNNAKALMMLQKMKE